MRVLVMLQVIAPWDDLLARLQALWTGIENSALNLVVALIVLLVSWALGRLVGWLSLMVLRRARFNEGMRGLLGPAAGVHEPAAIASWLLYWLVLTLGGLLALDWLGFDLGALVGARLRDVLPRILASAILLVVGVLFSMLLGAIVRRFFQGAGFGGARLRGQIVTAVFTVFSVLMALEQLGFAAQFVMWVGIIAFAASGLAIGLAFGLGCRDLARDFVVEYLRSIDEGSSKR
jgi:mechanosensitive ion channel-like protein